ncbi:hypothetical protein GIV17_20690 [Pseudomonas syringae]|nr:hypothetical protein [Pseudomonas syringae]MCF5756122.1 hypothetical protein [Pseudomonas syringae]
MDDRRISNSLSPPCAAARFYLSDRLAQQVAEANLHQVLGDAACVAPPANRPSIG